MMFNRKHDFERGPVTDAKRRNRLSRITNVSKLFIVVLYLFRTLIMKFSNAIMKYIFNGGKINMIKWQR